MRNAHSVSPDFYGNQRDGNLLLLVSESPATICSALNEYIPSIIARDFPFVQLSAVIKLDDGGSRGRFSSLTRGVKIGRDFATLRIHAKDRLVDAGAYGG